MINSNLRLVVSNARRYRGRACRWATSSRRASSASTVRSRSSTGARASSSRRMPRGGSGKPASAPSPTSRRPSGSLCTSRAPAKLARFAPELRGAARPRADARGAGGRCGHKARHVEEALGAVEASVSLNQTVGDRETTSSATSSAMPRPSTREQLSTRLRGRLSGQRSASCPSSSGGGRAALWLRR